MNLNKYVFIGDSLTFGFGVKKTENWVTLVSKKLNGDFINKGINGNTSTDILFRFSEDVINELPSTVFIMVGTNDLLSNYSVDSIIINITLMIKEALNNSINVILGIPPTIIPNDIYNLTVPNATYDYCFDSLKILSERLKELSKIYSLDYIDFYKASNDNLSKNIFIDGIHLNPLGQSIFAEAFLKIIVE